MKKAIHKILLVIFVFAIIFSVSACNLVPETIGDPLGMYLYNGAEKMLLDGSEKKQVVEQIEFEGAFYDIIITDYHYEDDYFYFCAEFENNNYIGLFKYDFKDKQTTAIYIKNISDKAAHTQFEIYHMTNYFITLQQCELDAEGYCGQHAFGTHEYYSVDYSGNIIETGFDVSEKNGNKVAYTDSYRFSREKAGSENIFEIEHLMTREKITLGIAEGNFDSYGLRLYETEELFCLVANNDDHNRYLALYDKETKTLYNDFWGIDSGFVINISYGLLYADNNIYQFQSENGFVSIHSTPYDLIQAYVTYDEIFVFSIVDDGENIYDYFYDMKTNQFLKNAPEIYSYYLDGYVFYITQRPGLMTTYYYLNRLCLETQKSEIVYYSVNQRIDYDRIDY